MSERMHLEEQEESAEGTRITTKTPRRVVSLEPGRRVVKTIELEPEDYVRVAFTMPTDLLARIDEAAKLYGITRSTLIQNACKTYLDEDLVGTDWLRHLLQHKGIKKGSTTGYDVDAFIDELSYYYVPGLNEQGIDLYLTPEHLQIIRRALEPEKTIRGKNKWLEFCEKTGLDNNSIPRDKPVKLIFEVKEWEE
jgi:hypothetical protein